MWAIWILSGLSFFQKSGTSVFVNVSDYRVDWITKKRQSQNRNVCPLANRMTIAPGTLLISQKNYATFSRHVPLWMKKAVTAVSVESRVVV